MSWSAGWSLVVPKGSRRIEAATRFMAYACGAEGQKRYTVDTVHLPTYRPLMEDSSLFSADHQFFRRLLLEGNSTSLPSQVPVNVQLWDAMALAQYEATIEQKDPLAVLQDATNKVQTDYNQYR